MTKTLHELIGRVASQQRELERQEILAPRLPGGAIRARVGGLIQTFDQVAPEEFRGWGIWRARSSRAVELVEPAGLPAVSRYLELLIGVPLWLARPIGERAWQATPGNTSDMRQRVGWAAPVRVELVEQGRAFDRALARFDGRTWWFEQLDVRADPVLGQRLREALEEGTPPGQLELPGLVPERRAAYQMAWRRDVDARRRHEQRERERDIGRVSCAIEGAGGQLEGLEDRGEFWLIEWTGPGGWRGRSAVNKDDLGLLSAGICLSGEDRKFDLASLIGVVEARPWR